MIPAAEALARLGDGNARFVSGSSRAAVPATPERLRDLAAGQRPFAVVLGCADSRVPPERVFDCDLGELFTVRVAGHVAGPTEIGSVEFAVEQLGARLVVVLGHSGCGAVAATLAQIEAPSPRLSPGLQSLVTVIRPAVEPLVGGADPEGLGERAVGAHVSATVLRLRETSEPLARAVAAEGLQIVGATYRLEDGVVTFS